MIFFFLLASYKLYFSLFLERTYRKAPQSPPTSVFIKGVNPSTFKIVWRYVAPSTLEEPLSGYKVMRISDLV